ncbi:MAG: SAVED domain-containing protein [Thermosipho sp. (in: Bacteria)]|nr:SAVED domain-containing protein [Thermosipho sp. (in: thermotogales)]
MYSNVLKNSLEDFLYFLKIDQLTIREAIEAYLKLKNISEKNKVFYEIMKKMHEKKEKTIPESLLKQFFENNEEIIFDFYRNDYVEAKFPIVNGSGRGKVVKVMVFETSDTFTNISDVENEIKKIEEIVGKKLGVIFDSNFSGNSFEMAVSIAALTKRIPSNLAFSGEVALDGTVKKNLEFLSFKEEISQQNNLKLITAFDVDNIFELKEFFEAKEYHIPILLVLKEFNDDYIEAAYMDLKEEVSRNFPMKFINLFERIYDTKRVYVRKEINKNEWGKILNELYRVVYQVISNKGIPHIAIIGPAALAMGLGIAIGAQNPLVVYHKQGKYFPVIDLTDNVRKIKTIVKKYKHLKYSITGNGENCAFVVYLASHNLYDSVLDYIRTNNLNSKVVLIEPKAGGGSLPPVRWDEFVSEIMSITQNIHFETKCNKVYFFLSCPVPLALGIGMAYGDFSKGSIFHFDKTTGTYIEVYKIEEIRGS